MGHFPSPPAGVKLGPWQLPPPGASSPPQPGRPGAEQAFGSGRGVEWCLCTDSRPPLPPAACSSLCPPRRTWGPSGSGNGSGGKGREATWGQTLPKRAVCVCVKQVTGARDLAAYCAHREGKRKRMKTQTGAPPRPCQECVWGGCCWAGQNPFPGHTCSWAGGSSPARMAGAPACSPSSPSYARLWLPAWLRRQREGAACRAHWAACQTCCGTCTPAKA